MDYSTMAPTASLSCVEWKAAFESWATTVRNLSPFRSSNLYPNKTCILLNCRAASSTVLVHSCLTISSTIQLSVCPKLLWGQVRECKHRLCIFPSTPQTVALSLQMGITASHAVCTDSPSMSGWWPRSPYYNQELPQHDACKSLPHSLALGSKKLGSVEQS